MGYDSILSYIGWVKVWLTLFKSAIDFHGHRVAFRFKSCTKMQPSSWPVGAIIDDAPGKVNINVTPSIHMFEARMLQHNTCLQFAQQPWEQSERSHQQIAYNLVNGCRPVCLNRLAILQGPRRLFRNGSWASRDDQHDIMFYCLWYIQQNCKKCRVSGF